MRNLRGQRLDYMPCTPMTFGHELTTETVRSTVSDPSERYQRPPRSCANECLTLATVLHSYDAVKPYNSVRVKAKCPNAAANIAGLNKLQASHLEEGVIA